MEKFKIAGYLRISVDIEQDRDNTSIENQRKIIERYVDTFFKGSEVDFYVDRDKSGYYFEQRKGYQSMRPKLMNNYYDILIIKDLSRLSRRNSEGLLEVEKLRDAGIRLIAESDGIDYSLEHQEQWQLIQFKFMLNETPVTDASKKVKRVIESKQEKGEWICSVPYGYVITNTKSMIYKVDDQAAEIVKKVFELYLDGWGYKKIAEYLTQQKIPTPRMMEKARKEADGTKTNIKASTVWATPTIKGILSNDFYIGTLRQRKYTRKQINGVDFKVDEEEHRVFLDRHEPIIDAKTFAKAQEQLKGRSKSNYRGQKKYDTTYSGFMFCGDCGSPMFSMSRPDLAPAYICGAYHKHGKKTEVGGCTSHHTRIDVLDTMLKKYVERVMQNSESMIKELESAIKDEPAMRKSSKTLLENLEIELQDAEDFHAFNLEQKNQELFKARKAGYTPEAFEQKCALIEAQYKPVLEKYEAMIAGLQKQIEFQIERENTTIQINRIAKTAIEIFRDIIAKPKLDKNDLSLIVDKITIFDDNIEIQLKADIAMLLETGTISNELLEQSSFVGTAVNFKWDTKSISNAQVVQKATHQKDKAFSVNVICEGDPLEIYTEKDGGVIFRKYSPMGDLQDFAAQICEAIGSNTGLVAAVSDRDSIIALSGAPKRELLDKPNSQALERLMENRKNYRYQPGEDLIRASDGSDKYYLGVAAPILSQGDLMGCVMLLVGENDPALAEADQRLAQTVAGFLGKQMES